MATQVQDILKDAMGLIGVIEIDEAPSSSELNKVLRACNSMLGRWSIQRLMLRGTTPITVPLTQGKYMYTIFPDPTADVNAPKPIKIKSGYYLDSNGNKSINQIVDYGQYLEMSQTQSQGMPDYIAYDPGISQQSVHTGTIYTYLVPDKSYTLYLEAECYFNKFVNLTDLIQFEEGYEEALIYNLAVRIFRMYNSPLVQIPLDIVNIANISLSNIKTMNHSPTIAKLDIPGKNSCWNGYTDGYL